MTSDYLSDNYSFIKKYIDFLNQQEFYFRTKERKKLHPDWRIEKVRQSKIWTFDGVFTVFYTVYYNYVNGKKRKFTYYHSKELKYLIKYKYEKNIIKTAIENLKSNKGLIVMNNIKIHYNTVKYHLKNLNLNKQLEQKIDKELIEFTKRKYKKIDIMCDDTFININIWKKVLKNAMFRLITFIGTDESNKKHTVAIIMTNSRKNTQSFYNEFTKRIKSFLELCCYKKLSVYGDGATWIKKFSEFIGGEFIFDKYHFFIKYKMLVKPYLSKIEDENYKNLINKKIRIMLDNVKYDKTEEDFWATCNDVINTLKGFNFKELLKRFEEFKKYVCKNKGGIWENNILKSNGSKTEIMIRCIIKNCISKRYTTYSFEMIKTIIMTKNIKNNIFAKLFVL